MEILISKGKIATGRNGCLYFTEVASFMWALLHRLAMQVAVTLKSKATVSSQLCPTSRRYPHTISHTNAHEGQRQGIDSTWGHLSARLFSTVCLKTGHSLPVQRTYGEYVVSHPMRSISRDTEARKMVEVPCTRMDSQSCCSGVLGGTPGLGTALTGGVRLQQEKNCAAAALILLAPMPLTLWRPAGQPRGWGSMHGLGKENGGQHTWLETRSSPVLPLPQGLPLLTLLLKSSRT